jgi:hypothetical protein
MLVVALTAGGLLYFGKLRYVPRAARHVPASAAVVARLSVERVGLFDPARTHLMPLVDSVGSPPGATSRRLRMEKSAKLEFNVDLREVAVGLGPASDDWVVVFGGMFPRGQWVSQVADLLKQEGRRGHLRDGAWQDESGFVLAQADDGCVIVASSRAQLAAALPATSAPPGAGAPADIEVWLRPGGHQLLRGKGVVVPREVVSLRGVAAGTGAEVAVQAEPGGIDAVRAEMTRLGAKKVESGGPGVRASLPREGLDRVAAELASWLKGRLGVPGVDVGQAKTR